MYKHTRRAPPHIGCMDPSAIAVLAPRPGGSVFVVTASRTLNKRASDFAALHRSLLASGVRDLPPLGAGDGATGWGWRRSAHKASAVEMRRLAFEYLLRFCAQTCPEHDAVAQFWGVQGHPQQQQQQQQQSGLKRRMPPPSFPPAAWALLAFFFLALLQASTPATTSSRSSVLNTTTVQVSEDDTVEQVGAILPPPIPSSSVFIASEDENGVEEAGHVNINSVVGADATAQPERPVEADALTVDVSAPNASNNNDGVLEEERLIPSVPDREQVVLEQVVLEQVVLDQTVLEQAELEQESLNTTTVPSKRVEFWFTPFHLGTSLVFFYVLVQAYSYCTTERAGIDEEEEEEPVATPRRARPALAPFKVLSPLPAIPMAVSASPVGVTATPHPTRMMDTFEACRAYMDDQEQSNRLGENEDVVVRIRALELRVLEAKPTPGQSVQFDVLRRFWEEAGTLSAGEASELYVTLVNGLRAGRVHSELEDEEEEDNHSIASSASSMMVKAQQQQPQPLPSHASPVKVKWWNVTGGPTHDSSFDTSSSTLTTPSRQPSSAPPFATSTTPAPQQQQQQQPENEAEEKNSFPTVSFALKAAAVSLLVAVSVREWSRRRRW